MFSMYSLAFLHTARPLPDQKSPARRSISVCVFMKKPLKNPRSYGIIERFCSADTWEADWLMDRKTQALSLAGGCLLAIYGLKRLYDEGDWVLVIIGVLIVAFTASNMIRKKPEE
jgi:hypothetical protein